jgi:hypothetical protein
MVANKKKIKKVGEPLIWKTRGLEFLGYFPLKQWPSLQGGPRNDAVTLKIRRVVRHKVSKVGLGTLFSTPEA